MAPLASLELSKLLAETTYPNSGRGASALKAYVPIADIPEALCRATSPLSVSANGQRLD
jgi:hypothetical protein